MIGDGHSVALDVVAGAGTVSSNDAVSLGLIVTEAVINSLKHAFPTSKTDSRITVSYEAIGADWTLAIKDNGVGKQSTGAAARKPGLGTSIVNALAQQLEARVEVASDRTGTTVSIIHVAAVSAV